MNSESTDTCKMPTASPADITTTMETLESAAFSAWPSEHSTDVKGWILRLDRGYTKRANSLNATARSQRLSEADLDSVETRFLQLGLTPTIRLTSFAPVYEVDKLLERRGYRCCDLSLVMTRALSAADGQNQEAQALPGERRNGWRRFRLLLENRARVKPSISISCGASNTTWLGLHTLRRTHRCVAASVFWWARIWDCLTLQPIPITNATGWLSSCAVDF